MPGIVSKLAERVYLTLGIESLEELERAADDGRLRQVAGFGSNPAFNRPGSQRPGAQIGIDAYRRLLTPDVFAGGDLEHQLARLPGRNTHRFEDLTDRA